MTDLQTELSNTAELLAASTEARRLAGGTGQMSYDIARTSRL